MHRSGSSTRASDEFLLPGSLPPATRSLMEADHLPTYDPQSDIGKKEALSARFAQNTIHLIPVVLILCAVVLWLFSSPQIDMLSKDDSIVARIENMTIDGYNNLTISSPRFGPEDSDSTFQVGMEETEGELENKEPE